MKDEVDDFGSGKVIGQLEMQRKVLAEIDKMKKGVLEHQLSVLYELQERVEKL